MDSIVMFDYATGRSRGFGFVTYEDPAVAHYLLSLGHEHNQGKQLSQQTGRVQMRDKLVEIKAAEPKDTRGRSHPRMGRPKGNNNNNNKPIAHNNNIPEAYAVAEDPSLAFYGQPYAGMMPPYGYHYPAPFAVPPPYSTSPYPPNPFVPGYMAPVYYPPVEGAPAAPMPTVAPEHAAAAAPFAGYAFIPYVPPPHTAGQDQV